MSRDDKRLVDDDRRGSFGRDDQTVAKVRAELASADDALRVFDTLDPDTTQHASVRVNLIVVAYDALNHLDRWLPPVAGWCCGYPWGRPRNVGDEGPYSVFSAHKTRRQANMWLAYWRREIPSRTAWEVTWRETNIRDFRAGGPPR